MKRLMPYAAFLMTLAILIILYPSAFFKANKVWFGHSEDGVKNYYTIAWHVKYDASPSHFEGMNHPFGEHIMFTDGQPVLSYVLFYLNKIFPTLSDYTVGIINLLMLFAVALGAQFICRLLIKYGVKQGVAWLAAVGMALLSPQWLRFTGHYALAYIVLLPWILWRLAIYTETLRLRDNLALAGIMLLAIGLHLYYLLIAGFFLGLFYTLHFLMRKSPLVKMWLLSVALQLFAPLLVFVLWLKLTDGIADRPASPYGLREYMAYWEGVFLPLLLPIGQWLKSVVDVRVISFEAYTYAGLPATVYFLFRLFTLPFKKGRLNLPTQELWLLAATLVFIFAATFPYLVKIPMVDAIMGPLKQFRSLGRLNWIFVLVLNVLTFVYLAKQFPTRQWISYTAALIIVLEGFSFHYLLKDDLLVKRAHWGSEWNAIKREAENFLIVPAPYFHIGSENLGVPMFDTKLNKTCLDLSLALGIPTSGVLMSRTSITQSVQQLERAFNLSGPLFPGERKKWLVVYPSKTTWPLLALYKPVSKPIKVENGLVYATLEVSELQKLMAGFKKTVQQIPNNSSDLIELLADGNPCTEHSAPGVNACGIQVGLTQPYLIWGGQLLKGYQTWSFWLKADMDGIRQLKLVLSSDKSSKEYRPDGIIKQYYNGFARVELTVQADHDGVYKLQLQHDPPIINKQVIIDEVRFYRGKQLPPYLSEGVYFGYPMVFVQ